MPSSSRRLVVRVVVAFVAILVIVMVVRSRSGGGSNEGAKAAERGGGGHGAGGRVVPVVTAAVERRDVPIWLEGLGTVAAWQQVTVRPQVDGRLDRVFFTEGQFVHRGQVLAQIDPRPFEAQLHSAEGALARDRAQLRDARLNLERYKQLVAQKLIAQQQVDDQAAVAGQAEGAAHADEAAAETARLNLDYARVKAPIDGVVGVRLVDPGNLVRANDTNGLVVLTQLDPAALFVTLPEDALPEVAAAMQRGPVPVEAWSRDGATRLGRGTVFVIDNQINAATATLRLKCKLPNQARTLWPNQFVKARVLVDTKKAALVVPAAAVQRGPQGPFVYVVAGGKAEVRPVAVGLTTGDVAVIDQGLQPGEPVVVEGQAQLRQGAAVQAHPAEGKGPDGKSLDGKAPDGKGTDGRGAGGKRAGSSGGGGRQGAGDEQ